MLALRLNLAPLVALRTAITSVSPASSVLKGISTPLSPLKRATLTPSAVTKFAPNRTGVALSTVRLAAEAETNTNARMRGRMVCIPRPPVS